jgi:7-cyano-7-deazaguanine synthase
MIANHGGDHAIYPDCRPGFIEAMSQAIAAGTYKGIRLDAPYTNLTKAAIACRGRELGVDYSLTYSCYKGGEKHCGVCATCVERREAMTAAGLDPDC